MTELKFTEVHLPCPNPSCKSSDAFCRNEDGSGKCFSCGKFSFPKPFWDHLKECTERPYQSRGVPEWVGERLGFTEFVDAKGFTQFFAFNDRSGARKLRRALAKEEQQSDKKRGVDYPPIVGADLYDVAGKTCVVVEGEPDMAAAYYMLNNNMKTETPVFCIPGATMPRDKAKRRKIFDVLDKYERVVVASENDEPGKKLKSELSAMLKDKLRVATINKHHDANDYLLAGDGDDFKRAVTNCSHYTPDYIYNGLERFAQLWNDPVTEFYVPTEFPLLNKIVPGIPTGGITIVTGPEGIGKTEFMRSLAWSVLSKKGEIDAPVSITCFEESNKTTLDGFATLHQEVNYRDHFNKPSFQQIAPTLEFLDDNLFITDLYKAAGEMSIASFMRHVEYLHFVCGVRYFFFDPINQLRPDNPEETLEKFLTGIMLELSRFCVDNNVGVVTTAHTNDDGQTRDSRMIAKQASIRIDLYRDLKAEDEESRNRTFINVTKNRTFSMLGPAGYADFDKHLFKLVQTDDYTETYERKETQDKPSQNSQTKFGPIVW